MSTIRVLMAPDYRADNPYQTLLANGLAKCGVEVTFPKGYRRVLPLSRAISGSPARIDVLHLHWQEAYVRSESLIGTLFYGTKLLLDLVCVKLRGCRLVWTIHNDLPHDTRWPRLHKRLQRAIARLADGVIFHSRSAHEQLQERLNLPVGKAHIIAHGHYRDWYGTRVSSNDARQKLDLPQEGRLFMYFGLIRPYKGVEDLIDAWRDLTDTAGDAHLVITGRASDAAMEGWLRERAKLLPRIILRLGFVPDEQVRLYFSAADVLVLPYRRALTSGSLMLALGYGLPVIAPKLAAFSEYTTSAGLLYEPEAEKGLISRMLECLESHPLPTSCCGVDWEGIAAVTAARYSACMGIVWPLSR